MTTVMMETLTEQPAKRVRRTSKTLQEKLIISTFVQLSKMTEFLTGIGNYKTQVEK